MKQNLSLWQSGGFVFAVILGTLLHFLYVWTGGSVLVAPFSAVNESTWEHMKLLFFPLFFFALLQSRFFKGFDNFWCVKLTGISVGLLLVPVLFYTINGAFGKTPDWVNISIFFISAAAVFLLETRLFKSYSCRFPLVAFCIISLIGISFIIFTFFLPIFLYSKTLWLHWSVIGSRIVD